MTEFDQVYQNYFPDVYKYLLVLCRDRWLAEEITQETFFKALQRLDDFDGRSSLYSWLCQIAKHTYQGIHALPEPYKEVFLLRLFGELSFAQIAALFHKTESWARVTYYRAKGKIKEGLP